MDNLSRPITSYDIELVIKKLTVNRSPILEGFTGEFYPTCKEDWIAILLKLFPKNWKGEKLPNSLYKATVLQYWSQTKMLQRKDNYRSIFIFHRDAKSLSPLPTLMRILIMNECWFLHLLKWSCDFYLMFCW